MFEDAPSPIAPGVDGVMLDTRLGTELFLRSVLPVPALSVPFTVNGVKGMGEGGAIGPGAAIAGAVEDAIRPLTDAFVDRLPITPERVARWISGDLGR